MSRTVAYKCKSPGCAAWFPIREMPDDTVRSVHFVLRLEVEPERLRCPDCGREHEYFGADKEVIQGV
jgi:hypothetical protein